MNFSNEIRKLGKGFRNILHLKCRKDALLAKTASTDNRQKIVSIQVHEEKPILTARPTTQDSIIKVAQTSNSKKIRWPVFWKRQDKNIPSEDKQIVKREIMPQKVETKTEAPKKESSGEPETKSLEPGGKKTKGGASRIRVAEEPEREIREPASNIRSTDTTAISMKRGKQLKEAFDEEHHVSVIEFIPNISLKNSMIRIEKLKATSHLVEEIPSNIIFENFNIWANIPEKNIDKPVIVFKVDQGWITENHLREIQLYKYIAGEWVLQGPTEKLDEDEEHFYFETQARGISGSYAIVGNN